MASTILEARNLTKRFGGLVAVDDVSLTVEAGSFHSIIGPNGAGKTTLFNVLSRTLDATAGQVIYRGQDITQAPLHRIAHLGIGRSFQITNVFPNLSAHENVRLACQALGTDNHRLFSHVESFARYHERAMQVIEQVGLSARAQQPARVLPQGDQRKLELGMLLAADPQLLLLDEPTAGMAGEQVPEFMALIRGIQKREGKTILLVEHNMNVVMSASDVITVMHQGRVLAEGAPAAISANHDVQVAYLGGLYNR